MNRAVVIMAKLPVAGSVKTRLQSFLSPEKCAELAAAFLADTINKAKLICENIILAYAPAGQKKLPENPVLPEIVLVEQKGENLGERMSQAFEFAFSKYSLVVMIGTDSPTFPAEYLAEAFEALEKEAEIVLGQASDGGFYLIGLRKPRPNLFRKIAWSSPEVFEQLMRNIKTLGIEKVHFIPEHYDVDMPDDFLRLKDEVLKDEKLQKLAQNTYRWLAANDERA